MPQFFGKYRGTVANNIDPMQMGRIQAIVPDVGNSVPTSWALPCLPMTGQTAGVFMVPPMGASVWIEFEQGNPDYPIWTGGFWGSASEVPPMALATVPPLQTIVLQTTGQNTLMISDTPGPTGGFLLKTASGAMIAINDVGITISNGQGATIALTGPSVTINQGALAVT